MMDAPAKMTALSARKLIDVTRETLDTYDRKSQMVKVDEIESEQDKQKRELALLEASFEMPNVKVGQAVRYYLFGQRANPPDDSSDRVQIAFVQKVGKSRRNVVVRLATGDVKEQVRHIEDPKLKKNVHQRQNGAWDHTEDQFDTERVLADVKKRLDAIESDHRRAKAISEESNDVDRTDFKRLEEMLGDEFSATNERFKQVDAKHFDLDTRLKEVEKKPRLGRPPLKDKPKEE